MNRLTVSALLFLTTLGCSHRAADDCLTVAALPRIGSAYVPHTNVAVPTVLNHMVFCVRHHSVAYGVKVNNTSGLVAQISTSDPRFVSPEGLTTKSSPSQLLAVGGRLLRPDHFSCSVALPSGWVARVSGAPDPSFTPTPSTTEGPYVKDAAAPPVLCTRDSVVSGHVIAFERSEEGGV